jgi:hypothetical protein
MRLSSFSANLTSASIFIASGYFRCYFSDIFAVTMDNSSFPTGEYRSTPAKPSQVKHPDF